MTKAKKNNNKRKPRDVDQERYNELLLRERERFFSWHQALELEVPHKVSTKQNTKDISKE
jgi:hypothetical protein